MLKTASVLLSGFVLGYFFGNLILGVLVAFGIEWLMRKPTAD